MDRKEKFLIKLKKTHGDNIDTSKVEYVNSQTKVCLICHKKDKNGIEHGEFWQAPADTVRGRGCPKCANEKRGPRQEDRMTTEKYIQKEREVHGDKYDLSKAVYNDSKTKMCFICPIHGEFWQGPYQHLSGQGCPKCAGRSWSQEDAINAFREEQGDFYIYDKVIFKGMKIPVTITCPVHGDFQQTPDKHLQGHGCPICGNIKNNADRKITFDKFIDKANIIHNFKYKYINNTVIENMHSKITAVCPIHGEFRQIIADHLNGHGCPKCGYNLSKAEDDIISFIKDELHINNIIQRNKDIIPPFEIDIYLPDYNIGIEYNGVIWHSEKFGKDKYYHLKKTEECQKKGIKLIQIFEDEYNEHKEIVFEKIRHLLGKDNNKEKVYARKCTVKEINKTESETFLNTNHIQGFAPSTIYLGCYYNDALVAVMTFKKEIRISNKWELNRFATDISKHCIGIGGKMFSYFVKNYNPDYVKSFADRRWTLNNDNNLYTKLGFKLDEILKPDYSYVTSKSKREHKFNFRKKLMIKRYPEYNLTNDMTEEQMTKIIGVYKTWDCGKYKYVWQNESNGD